jgi:hypothetical protein
VYPDGFGILQVNENTGGGEGPEPIHHRRLSFLWLQGRSKHIANPSVILTRSASNVSLHR